MQVQELSVSCYDGFWGEGEERDGAFRGITHVSRAESAGGPPAMRRSTLSSWILEDKGNGRSRRTYQICMRVESKS